ncbi:MAG: Mrp/NBP35 family ATP-binding protein [Peptoniphilaceae bacterium]|nr:Mrp/NBP35 family ATP-binding protein [Peptoniphilaceae bacterium]MDY6019702.1 Mrp/NBP35 family ATP-binding protein [Anaerococcus sp.]
MSEKSQRKLDFKNFQINLREGSSVGKTIAVMSGKGGVGKSFISSMLASELSKKGYKVGILDADITGPSIPSSFGLKENIRANKEGVMQPQESKSGIKIVSINLILEDKTAPVIWRSSIVTNILKQFWTDVDWKDLDYMLVDMPPGTSDVPLTIFQSLPIDGVIAVTTPQDLVGMVVEKSLNMAKMMGKKIVGIVENMSYFIAEDTGKKYKIFGEGSLDKVKDKFGIKAKAKMPINPEITRLIDQGKIEDIDAKELEEIIKAIESL